MKNLFIFRTPFWSALTFSTTYVLLGIICAKTDLMDTFLFDFFAPAVMPLVGFFGINSHPSNLEMILASSVLIVIYSLVFTMIFSVLKNIFIKVKQ